MELRPYSNACALIAVQGPRAREIIAAAEGLDASALDGLGYYAAAQSTFDGEPLLLARTGQKEKARGDAAWLIAQEPAGIDTSRVLELMQSLK